MIFRWIICLECFYKFGIFKILLRIGMILKENIDKFNFINIKNVY